jgi:SpoVK/Ycf46/Vps4 family AAA+-type ATPase
LKEELKMVAVVADSNIAKKLKQAYLEKFGGSPKLLINELNNNFQDKVDDAKDVISDKTIRNFFNSVSSTKIQEKNLNYLCKVLLGYESYREALRQTNSFEDSDAPDVQKYDWLKEYQEYVRGKYGIVKVLDMIQPVQLTDIYAKSNVFSIIRGRQQKSILELLNSVSEDSRANQIIDVDSYITLNALEAIEPNQRLLIWGGPGAGKTTLLKYLAIQMLETAESLDEKTIPIFVSLKTVGDEQERSTLINIVEQEFLLCSSQSQELVHNLLKEGRCTILLDGLDEVADVRFNQVVREIENFIKMFPNNRFIITCRLGACDYIFENFVEVEIAEFSKNQIELFVDKWFSSRHASTIEREFLNKLDKNASIKELARNPLLLTLLCLVFEEQASFPRNRYALFDDAANILLRRWDNSRRIERRSINRINLSQQRKVNLLGKIAHIAFTQEPKKYLWWKWELEEIIRDFIQNIFGSDPKTIEFDSQEILKTIQSDYGLLIEQAKEIYSFSHLTFQEYFIAQYIVESRDSKILEESVDKYLTDRQWREIFILIAGRLSNADEFIKLIFKRVNQLANNEVLQEMLVWLDGVTRLHGICSSSWRAFYLAADQEFSLYTSQSRRDYTLAQNLARELRQVNKEQRSIIPRSPVADFALKLVAVHDMAIKQALGSPDVSNFLEETLPVEKNFNIPRSLQTQIKSAKEKGFTIARRKGAIEVGKEAILEEDANVISELDNRANIDQSKGLIAVARELKFNDLADELSELKQDIPSKEDSIEKWANWLKKLRARMILYLDIGYKVQLSDDEVQSLEDYFYANSLLLDCIRSDSYISTHLRNQIIEYLLLPLRSLPKELK